MGAKGPPFTCIGHFDETRQQLKFWYAGADSAPRSLLHPRSADAEEGEAGSSRSWAGAPNSAPIW